MSSTAPAVPTSTAGLTPEQINELSPYGYVPTEWICTVFLVLFAVTTALHLGQAIWFRCWWLMPTVIFCSVLEVLGWAGRLWSVHEVMKRTPFMTQIVTTVLGPTPLLAANFIIMGRVVGRLGAMYSRLSPRLYSVLFLSCDIISLIVQGVGGGTAASADNDKDADKGGNIMLGGIAFQIIVILFFTIVSAEFLWRYASNRPLGSRQPSLPTAKASAIAQLQAQSSTLLRQPHAPQLLQSSPRLQLALVSVAGSTALLFIRAVYRTIELADGWGGKIITTEVWFNIFDAAMVVVAMYLGNVLHPGWLLVDADKERMYKLEEL